MPTFARPRRSVAYRTVAAGLFPAERFAGIESAAALWPLAATGFSANTSRVRHGLRMTAMGPEGPVMKKLHRSYRRLKNETAHGFKPKRHLWSENVGYPHPRRVIHTYPHRNAIRHIARHYATQHGAAQQKRKTRRSGPSCKNLRSRIAAQQHRRNGKSIQCPFNVTTYLGHTHLVGLCSSVVLVLRNYARHCGKCKPKQDDVPYLSQLLLSDRKNRKNAPCCANRNACLFIHVHLPRKNGVSEAYFTNSANEC